MSHALAERLAFDRRSLDRLEHAVQAGGEGRGAEPSRSSKTESMPRIRGLLEKRVGAPRSKARAGPHTPRRTPEMRRAGIFDPSGRCW
jgi:hypothetical protein